MEKEYQNTMVIFDDGKCGFTDLTNVEKNGNRVTGGFKNTRGFQSLKGRTIEFVLLQYDVTKKNQGPNEENLF